MDIKTIDLSRACSILNKKKFIIGLITIAVLLIGLIYNSLFVERNYYKSTLYFKINSNDFYYNGTLIQHSIEANTLKDLITGESTLKQIIARFNPTRNDSYSFLENKEVNFEDLRKNITLNVDNYTYSIEVKDTLKERGLNILYFYRSLIKEKYSENNIKQCTVQKKKYSYYYQYLNIFSTRLKEVNQRLLKLNKVNGKLPRMSADQYLEEQALAQIELNQIDMNVPYIESLSRINLQTQNNLLNKVRASLNESSEDKKQKIDPSLILIMLQYKLGIFEQAMAVKSGQIYQPMLSSCVPVTLTFSPEVKTNFVNLMPLKHQILSFLFLLLLGGVLGVCIVLVYYRRECIK